MYSLKWNKADGAPVRYDDYSTPRTPKAMVTSRTWITLPDGKRKKVWVQRDLAAKAESAVCRYLGSLRPKQKIKSNERHSLQSLYKYVSRDTVRKYMDNPDIDLEETFNDDLFDYLEPEPTLEELG
jgi:hypothetical protein